jgi:carbon-monoxide dehydrogenase large subunit
VDHEDGTAMSILGNRVLRREDAKLLTSGGEYVADLSLPGCAWVTFVRSTVAHGRITSLDVKEVRSAPGVIEVFTGDDLDLEARPPDMALVNQSMKRDFLARDVVRFVGEPVVAIVSETREQGADASELVFVDYEPLPTVVDVEDSLREEVLLFPESGTNVAFAATEEPDPALFEGCDVVVTGRTLNQRVAPCPLEVRAAAATWEPDGRLLFNASTQAPHAVRDALAQVLEVEPSQVHVVSRDVGGGFGAKGSPTSEELLVAWLARRTGRTCRWVETRSESMLGLGHGRGQVQDFEIGGTRDGRILAYRLAITQDSGAYPGIGAMLPFLTKMMATGTYDIAKLECTFKSVVTNTTPTTAYRGAGRPEATAVIERAVDRFASEIGMDPAEVRRINLIPEDRFPYQSAAGALYDSGAYHRALDTLLATADYGSLRERQAERRKASGASHLGIGLSCYVEITNGVPGGEFGSVEVLDDGKVLVKTGTSPHGQGHVTAWSMIVADALGVDMEDIEVVHGDTDLVASGVGTFASRSLQTGGASLANASADVTEQAKGIASQLLEADEADIVLDKSSGRFHVAGTPAVSRSWAELAAAAVELGKGALAADANFVPEGPSYPFGCHLAVVEVDSETGRVNLERMITVDDAGTILNPLLAGGQVHGGLAQGIAQALLEEFVYDEDGNPLTTTLADYSFISAPELPSFENQFMQTPTKMNALGAKGIGESGTVGATPAVQNAVVDALSHLGVLHVDMPTTPERVWRAIEDAKGRGQA